MSDRYQHSKTKEFLWALLFWSLFAALAMGFLNVTAAMLEWWWNAR